MSLHRILLFNVKRILFFDLDRILTWDIGRVLRWRIPSVLLKGLAGWFLASIALQAMGIRHGVVALGDRADAAVRYYRQLLEFCARADTDGRGNIQHGRKAVP